MNPSDCPLHSPTYSPPSDGQLNPIPPPPTGHPPPHRATTLRRHPALGAETAPLPHHPKTHLPVPLCIGRGNRAPTAPHHHQPNIDHPPTGQPQGIAPTGNLIQNSKLSITPSPQYPITPHPITMPLPTLPRPSFLALAALLSLGLIPSAAIANAGESTAMAQLDLPATPRESGPEATWDTTNSPMDSMVSQVPQSDISTSPSDVSPSHWAYPAVNSLVTNYGCLSGYPDGTFRGDQSVTRYEFAAALNACLGAILELQLQAESPALDSVLADLNDLRQELGTLSDQVDTLETTP